MISIIVCSVNAILFEKFEQNIAATIGSSYEIIKIENTGNQYSLAEAYNLGAGKAVFPFVCFVHEDVLFRTLGWGALLIGLFQNVHTGAIGIAGSKYKSLSPSGWPVGQQHLDCYNFVQYYQLHKKNILQINNTTAGHLLSEVKVLDGVFIFTTKDIWQVNKFDSNIFTGFHGYDLDFSLQVGLNHKVMVTYQVLLEHLSEGATGKEWIKNIILLSKKWKKHLPQGTLSYREKCKIEWQQKRHLFLIMLIYDFSLTEVLFVFFNFGYIKYFYLRGNMLFVKEIVNSLWRKTFPKSVN